MPIPKKYQVSIDIRKEAAALLQVDENHVFILPKTSQRAAKIKIETPKGVMRVSSKSHRNKPVVAVWVRKSKEDTAEWDRVYSLMPAVLKLAKENGYKAYLTSVHPEQSEAKEHRRRKSNEGNAFTNNDLRSKPHTRKRRI